MKNELRTKLFSFGLRKNSGYTLIEILVVTGILLTLFTFGYVGFRDYSRKQNLISAKRTLVGEIKLAQEYSLAGKKIEGCGTLAGYKVIIGEFSYSIEAVCDGGSLPMNEKTDVSYPEGVSVSPSTNFTFKVLGKGTDIGPDPVVITLTQEATLDTQTITISNSGEVI